MQGKDLDDDMAGEPGVARSVNLSHAACAQWLDHS
jgi:hypothetical protein